MSYVKQYLMERDETIEALARISAQLQAQDLSPVSVVKLKFITKILSDSTLYPELLDEAAQKSEEISHLLTEYINTTDNERKTGTLIKIKAAVNQLYRTARSRTGEGTAPNSDNYYESQIGHLKKEKEDLQKEVENGKKTKAEKEKLEEELQNTSFQLEQLKAAFDQKKKQDDAREEISKNISESFEELSKRITPLKREHERAENMYHSYITLSLILCAFLLVWETSIAQHFNVVSNDFWKQYIPYYLPIPLVFASLGVLIYQINRAQRQLVAISNILYHAQYVEGLALATNKITPEANESLKKVTAIIGMLVKSHLTPNSLNEETLRQLEAKDKTAINLHEFTELLKAIKEPSA